MVNNFSDWSAVILAGGRSQRFGAPKVVQAFNGVPFVSRIRKSLLKTGISEIVLVLGYQAQDIIPQIPDAKYFKIVVNKNFDSGQFSSLQAGLKKVNPDVKGIVMCLVDQPHVSQETYLHLLQAAKQNPQSILIPQFKNRGGHPVILPAKYFMEILGADPGVSTLKDIMHKHADQIRRIDVEDPAVLEDIDTRTKLLELERKYR